jgi:hypothetical protein
VNSELETRTDSVITFVITTKSIYSWFNRRSHEDPSFDVVCCLLRSTKDDITTHRSKLKH